MPTYYLHTDGEKRCARAWIFTICNWTPSDEERLKKLKFKYIIWGREHAPSTGTPHLQGYIYYKTTKSFDRARKEIGGDLLRARIAPF